MLKERPRIPSFFDDWFPSHGRHDVELGLVLLLFPVWLLRVILQPMLLLIWKCERKDSCE